MKKKFIKATEKYCTLENNISAPYLRRCFELGFVPEKAEISICGLGFYCLFINGQEITKGYFAPYISNPDDYCYYDKYDIAEFLQKGRNTICVILGNGLINSIGGYIWDFDKAEFRDAPKLAIELVAEREGYEKVFIEADENFKVCPSPIKFDDFRYGEYYDAREEIENWNTPDFDDSAWGNAVFADAPRGELRCCKAEPIKAVQVLKPKSIIKCKEGYVYDFGVNTAGLCKLNIRGSTAGQTLTFRYFELMRDGEPFIDTTVFSISRFPDYRDLNQKNIYVCRGDAQEEWIPRFTYHGFRYVLVKGITESQADGDLLTYHVMHSALKKAGDFKCSNSMVNKIFEMTVNSDLSNFYYFPTDCPHREKNGWTGDIAQSCFHQLMLYDCKQSYEQWLDNMRKAQSDEGIIPGIVPTTGWGYYKANGPAWDCAAFYLPYECWRLSGDTKMIEDNARMLKRYLEYILTKREKNGTVAFGLGDWSSVGRHNSRPETPLVVTDSIFVMDIAKKAVEMFDAIGDTETAKLARFIYIDMRNTVRRELLDTESCTIFGKTQTGQAIGLYYGVFEPCEEQRAFELLLELIRAKADSFDCGILGLHAIFHVLSRFGYGELAFKMITKKEYPSYGYLIENGETSLIERFMPNGSPEDSHNHHYMGDVARWFIRELAGLRVENYKTVVIKPDFLKEINSAEAYFELSAGRVSVKWERKADSSIALEYTCPDGVDVSVILPEGVACDAERK